VTHDQDTAAVPADPELIHTSFATDLDDIVEQLRAAATLGLGVRLKSFLVPRPGNGGSYYERWELDLLVSSPVREAEDDYDLDAEAEDEEGE
jgi:hypothetical protein